MFALGNALEVGATHGRVRGVQNLVAAHVLTLNQNIKSHTAGLSSINSNRAHGNGDTVAAATAERIQIIRTITLELECNSVGKAVGGLKQFHGHLHSS